MSAGVSHYPISCPNCDKIENIAILYTISLYNAMNHLNDFSMPVALQSIIGNESIDFLVKAKRKQPVKNSVGIITFGIIWTAFISIFVFAFMGPLFRGEEAHLEVDGVPTTASWDHFQPMVTPALIIGVFVLIGLGMLIWGFYSLFQKGGYFVGTNNRLIRYHKGVANTYDWEQFTGNMEINDVKGDISLQLRSGKMVQRKNKPDEFVPDTVYISGITDLLEVEKNCRKRIKENDPSPANVV